MTTLKFTKQRKGRKQLAAFLATQLRATVEYLGTPTFAYQIGEAMLDRDWLLHLPDDTDVAGLVEAAAQAGFPTDTTDEPGELGLTLAFPTTGWEDTTKGKVEATLAAKGELIAKALQIPATPMSIDAEAGTVEFPWFDVAPDPQVVEATTVLIARHKSLSQTCRNGRERQICDALLAAAPRSDRRRHQTRPPHLAQTLGRQRRLAHPTHPQGHPR